MCACYHCRRRRPCSLYCCACACVSGGRETPSEHGPHAAGDQMFAEGQKSPPPVYFRAPEVNGRRRMGEQVGWWARRMSRSGGGGGRNGRSGPVDGERGRGERNSGRRRRTRWKVHFSPSPPPPPSERLKIRNY